jgi:hypothetical protein
MQRCTLSVGLIVLGLCLLSAIASAQTFSPDTFKINYFANNGVSGAPDATVRIDNPGTNTISFVSSPSIPTATSGPADVCAMIYVYDNDQQLTECCGCLLTPDGLRTLSVGKNLTNNPLTGVVSNNGVIKIVSTVNISPCDPTLVAPDEVGPAIRGWASHVQNKVGAAYPITETQFTDATLSEPEFGNLVDQCFFAQRLGSGHAVCSCGTGD